MLASPADGAFLLGSALGGLFSLVVLVGGRLAGAVLSRRSQQVLAAGVVGVLRPGSPCPATRRRSSAHNRAAA